MTARPYRTADDDLDAALAEADRLRTQVSTLLSTHQQLSTLLVAADTRTGDLLKLLVSVRALIESRDASAALDRVQDILVTVIGCDEFTVFSIDPREQVLVRVGGTGTFVRESETVPLHHSWLGDVVRAGSLLISREPPRVPADHRYTDVVAVVPLKVLDRTVGAIVVTSLLPHREPLGACDREILDLLGVYAATAIIAADRRARWRQLPDALR
jgi:GAF domain-containing protein